MQHSTIEQLRRDPDFVALDGIAGVRIDLRYAGTNNFMSKDVYGEFKTAFLHRIAADMLRDASERLAEEKPAWKLLVLDALRPRAAQRVLWDYVRGTDQEIYVANPERGSVHNYGMAVDLTCVGEDGREIDMGSGFDTFIPLSQPKLEERLLASGELGREAWENRLVLRRAMTGAGFLQLPHEWWHYDALPRERIREGFRLIE